MKRSPSPAELSLGEARRARIRSSHPMTITNPPRKQGAGRLCDNQITLAVLPSACQLASSTVHTAPLEADVTSFAYFANTPRVYLGAGGVHALPPRREFGVGEIHGDAPLLHVDCNHISIPQQSHGALQQMPPERRGLSSFHERLLRTSHRLSVRPSPSDPGLLSPP